MNKREQRLAERAARIASSVVVDAPVDTIAETPVVDAPVVEPTTETPATVVVDPKSPWCDEHPIPNNRHTGRYTGMGVEQFQNRIYVMNAAGEFGRHADGSVRGLSDYQIAILWRVEFPNAKCDFMAHVDYVASTRTGYAHGKHSDTSPVPGCNITFTSDGVLTTKPYRGPSR